MEKFRIGGLAESCFLLAGIIMVAIVIMMLMSCKQIEYVTVEKVRNDTTYITKHQRDSVWLHDSIRVSEKGDTIRIEKWHTKYIEREVHDTLYRAKVDSIPVPYEVIKEVPRKKSTIELVVFCICIITIMALVLFLGLKLKMFLP